MANMMNMSMLPVTSNAFLASPTLERTKRRKRTIRTMKPSVRHDDIRIGLCDLSIEWFHLQDLPRRSILSKFIEALKLGHEKNIEELVVEDIDPLFSVGSDDPTKLLEIQDRIVEILMEAAVWRHDKTPEFRLTRRGNGFDIRFYLGRTQPTDACWFNDRD